MKPSYHFLAGLFVLLIFCGQNVLTAQSLIKRPRIEILRDIDLEEGRQRLSDFRSRWSVGDYSLKYDLAYIPRRGERKVIRGTLWGTDSLEGPISLIRIQGDPEVYLYLKNGPFASVHRKVPSGDGWKEIEARDWFEPIDEKVTLTAFDLMMPFVFWSEWTYEGATKVRSRVSHAFLMEAPDAFQGNPLGLHGVVIFLDERFNVPLKADYVTADDTVLKSLNLIDIKKVEGVWLPKTMDFLDEMTRNKTRMAVREAAMHRDFSQHPLGAGEPPESVPEIPLSAYVEVR